MRSVVARLAAMVSLVVAVAVGTVLAATPPSVTHDCSSIHTLPRPCDNDTDITRNTTIYFEVTEPLSGHFPNDGIDPDSVVASLTRPGQPAVTMFGPNQVWAPGFTGRATSFTASPVWGYGFYTRPTTPLLPSTPYTVTVTGHTKATKQAIDPTTATWTFTTRRSLTGATLTWDVALDGPTVNWKGRWFAGECKPNFDTSRSFDQEALYALMDTARTRAPELLLEQRDFPWMGEYWQANIFDGNPNIVRERETRRITRFTDLTAATELALTDLIEGPLYGIPPNRAISLDFHVDDLVLVCDATRSEVRKVLAVDDVARTIRVEKLATPASRWVAGDPAASPADDPSTPDNFTYPLAALRKYSPFGTPVYYWRRLDDELDQHVAHGRRPLVNPFSTPVDLCKTGLTSNAHGGVCENKPKDYAEWDGFVRTLIGHLIDRYGERVLDWTYSIGNEPDLSDFWKDSNAFFEYYDYTSNAILRAFEEHGLDASRVKIGGVEIGIFYSKINDMLYHCSPTANNPTSGFVETNYVCMDPSFDGRRAARVQSFCSTWGGKGCPLDYISLHTYTHAAEGASAIDTARNSSLSIDASFYENLFVHSHETTPDWVGARDPGWKEVYRWSGFFPSWGGDYFRRLLDAAMADPRKAGGQATLTAWPFNYNFAGDASIAGFMRVDENGDGTQDRVEGVASSFFRFAELAAWMSHDVASLPAVADAGDWVSGWRSSEPQADRFLLYAHDRLDTEGSETGGWDVTLRLSSPRFGSVEVTEYRVDRDHGAREALAALPDRGASGLYSPAELTDLIGSSVLRPLGPPACLTASGGSIVLATRVLSQGVTFLDAVQSVVPPEIAGVGFAADKTTLSWNSAIPDAGPNTVHDVCRGSVGQWPVGSGSSETCVVSGTAAATASDGTIPDPGRGFWYLVRGRNGCSTGTYGHETGGTERVTSACP